ncbi:hypothetical protein Nmel_017586 [Mimus melanotis]
MGWCCLGASKAFLRNPPLSCRLEVQADVQKEIFPKDSVSLGAISDNASTRAMAGSIISSYNPQDRECNNMEIQVDIEAKPSHYQLTSGSSTEDSLHTWDITLAQPESIRSDLESSDSQSDDVPDITSDECESPLCQTAAGCPQTPRARGAQSPSAHLSHCAQAEGCRLDEMVQLECIEARV